MIGLRKTSSFTRLVVLSLFLIMMLSSNTSHAQATASGEALATVLAGLSVIAVQDLQFGNVLQGVAKTVANDDAINAGIFTIAGEGGSGISVFLSLPEYLATNVAPLAEDRMQIVFSATDASVDTTNNVNPATFGSGWQNTNPYSLPSGLTVGTVGQNQTAIFLGGHVIPSVHQMPGVYTGLITITVAYNGT